SFVRDFSFGMRNTLFMMVPAVLLIGSMRTQIVRLLFEHGEFGAETTPAVAAVLFWLVPSMLAMGISYIAARALYARQRMYKPVTAGIISIICCRISAIWLMKYFERPGLAMANTVGDVANAVILLYILKNLVGNLDGRRIVMSQIRCLPANIFLVLSGLLLPSLVEQHLGTHGVLAKGLAVLVPAGVAVTGFLVIAGLMRVEELRSAGKLLSRRGRRTAEQAPEESE
ncbi:MAG: lipid II flippase MurJ, partial [Armatimonadia bacterium]